MKYLLLSGCLMLSSACFCQKKGPFHDTWAYSSFQFPKGDDPLVSNQLATEVKNIYFEARHNYEDRHTGALNIGRSFKAFKDQVEIIPMIGWVFGRFNGFSPGITASIETEKISAFSQNQYAFDIDKPEGTNPRKHFFFDWTVFEIKTYKKLYLGASLQTFYPQFNPSQVYSGPVASLHFEKWIFEGFAYNFWNDTPMWAFAVEFRIPSGK
jgi:hypothetical protein